MNYFTYLTKKRELRIILKKIYKKDLQMEKRKELEKQVFELSNEIYLYKRTHLFFQSKNLKKQIERKIANTKYNFKKSKHYISYYTTATIKKIAIAMCIVIFSTAAMQTEIIGAPVRKFLIHVYEKFQEFIYPEENRGEVPETIEKVYQITYLPDGYALDKQHISDLQVQTIYKSDGKPLIFQQNTVNAKVALDTEHKNGVEIIDDIEYFTVESDGTNLIFWLLDGYQFTLYSVENLTEMFKIATTISYN